MATAEQYVRKLLTGSDLHLAQAAGGRNSELNHFLLPYSFDRVLYEDTFQYKTFNVTDYWTTNAGTGATAFALPGTLGNGGTITAATGTNGTGSNRRVNMYGPPIYVGDQFLMMEMR